MLLEPAILTILHPLDEWAKPTKTVSFVGGRYQVGEEGERPGFLFDVTEVAVSTVEDIAAALAAQSHRPSFAIHGHLRAGRPSLRVRRLSGPDGNFEDRGTRICFVDVDSVPFSKEYDVDVDGFLLPDWQGNPIDPNPMIDYLRRMLPAAFHNAACCWYLTGGFGVKPGARVRLVFILDRPTAVRDLKIWFGGHVRKGEVPLYHVDRSIYQAGQPIYFQPPEIAADAVDPVKALQIPRAGILAGASMVSVSEEELHTRREEITAYRRSASARADGVWDAPLKGLGEEFGFFEPLSDAIKSYFRTWCEGDGRSAAALLSHLTAVISAQTPTRKYPAHYLQRRIADAANWCKVVEGHALRRRAEEALRRAGAVTRYPDKGGSPQDAHAKLIEGFDRLSEALAKRRKLQEFIGEHEDAVQAVHIIKAQAPQRDNAQHAPLSGISRLFEAAERWWSFSHELAPAVVKMTVGAGKTHQTILWALEEAQRGERVVIAVPTHENAGEVVDRIRRAAVDLSRLPEGRQIVGVWRGVERPADGGGSMCLDIERMKAGVSAGLTQESMCGGGRDRCAFFEQCAYRAQGRQSPLIWVVTHRQLAYAPREAMADPTLLIVDERLPVAGDPLSIDLLCLAGSVQGLLSSDADRAALANVVQTLTLQPSGELMRGGVERLRADLCRGIRYRLSKGNPAPADAYVASQIGGPALVELGQRRVLIEATRRLLRALADFLTGSDATAGRIVITLESGRPVAKVFDGRPISPKWASTLVVVLDATAELPIAQAQFGASTRLLVDARIEASNAVVTQTVDFSGSYKKLGKAKGWPDAELYERIAKGVAARVDRDLGGVRRPLIGIIGPIDLIENMRPWFLDWGIADFEFGHFYALRGLNNLEKVDALIVIGAPRTSAQVLENQHRTLFGSALIGTPVQRFVALRTAGNAPVAVEEWAYNDEWADALVRTSHDAEVEQAVGRARAVRRASPLSICIVNNVALDLTVDHPIQFAELIETTSREVASKVDGIVWNEARASALAYPHRFASAAAKRKGEQRKRGKEAAPSAAGEGARMRDTPLYDSIKGDVTHSARPMGRAKVRSSASRKRWNATVDPRTASSVEELQAVLDRHGALTRRTEHLTVESFEPAVAISADQKRAGSAAPPRDISALPLNEIVRFAKKRDPSFDVDAVLIHLIDIAKEVGVTIYTLDAMKQKALRVGHRGDKVEEVVSLELLKAAGPERTRAVTDGAKRRRLAIERPDLFGFSSSIRASNSVRM